MSRPPRAASFGYRGLHRYFLTFCCRNRERIFLDLQKVRDTLEHFRRCGRDERFEILAYCFMPDHVHLLVEGLFECDLRKFAKLAKQRSGAAFALAVGRRLWQEGYFDRILREDDDVRGVVRYLMENPVRANLVEHAPDYPYIGSDRWTLNQLLDVDQ